MSSKKHGVIVTLGRVQPFAVWVRGEIVFFTASITEADNKFQAEVQRARRTRERE